MLYRELESLYLAATLVSFLTAEIADRYRNGSPLGRVASIRPLLRETFTDDARIYTCVYTRARTKARKGKIFWRDEKKCRSYNERRDDERFRRR